MSLTSELEHFISLWASKISNRALETDPDLVGRLSALDGRCIELNCHTPNTTGYLLIQDGRLQFIAGQAASPHVIVTGDAINLVRWLSTSDATGITIEGDDTTLLETLAALRGFDPEVQATLSQIFGASFTDKILGGAEAGLQGVKSLLEGLGSGLERRAAEKFVRRENLDGLLDSIDDLRLRVDRLTANIRTQEKRQ
ncbi:MAG: ubiquinone biosynthesis protein UbiJ [Limisphaerales bacterium]|jgi:ubiquinone biosynthesis protein UbiJ